MQPCASTSHCCLLSGASRFIETHRTSSCEERHLVDHSRSGGTAKCRYATSNQAALRKTAPRFQWSVAGFWCSVDGGPSDGAENNFVRGTKSGLVSKMDVSLAKASEKNVGARTRLNHLCACVQWRIIPAKCHSWPNTVQIQLDYGLAYLIDLQSTSCFRTCLSILLFTCSCSSFLSIFFCRGGKRLFSGPHFIQ